MSFRRTGLISVILAVLCQSVFAQSIKIRPDRENGTYKLGETVHFKIQAEKVTEFQYAIKKGGLTELSKGKSVFENGAAELTATLTEPSTVFLEIKAKPDGGKEIRALGAAVFAPDQIQRADKRPADFDEFWAGKIKELSATPINPTLQAGESPKTNLQYSKITMDGYKGTKIYGQLARPVAGEKLPALLIVQWAGVYPLSKDWVIWPANEGFLVLNVQAHELPIDEPASFYKEKSDGPLKDNMGIGNDDRETSYFLRMYLSAYRAADYLAQRPDWDGKNLVVMGTSQGGMQTLMLSGLHPKITAAMANVAAGCDFAGEDAGRLAGWPQWHSKAWGKDKNKVIEAGRYYDVANFACNIKCPLLVSAGLIDEVCPAAGILAAVNQTKGPREIVILPLSDHMGTGDAQAAMFKRMGEWRAAIAAGHQLPPK